MKSLLFIAAALALAAARPETYKENEDFQYSRSSTDEGSKSGYYGAQRGNMGGNFERAHNMDGLAQHQMSTAVKQVDGELGEASKMKSGDVFTSATSGGMFGSGHYDVSNLQGRNFQESSSGYDAGSQSHSALSSHQSQYRGQMAASDMHSSGYNSISHGSGYRGYQGVKSGHELQSGSLQAAENVHDASYGVGSHGASSQFSSGHASQSGYHSSTYDGANANQYDSRTYRINPQQQILYATPVRIYGRPGTRVAIPVGVQTYDASSHSASTLGQQAFNSEAEVLSSHDQRVPYKPSSDGKHYESAFSYRKQWERHDTQPEAVVLAIPTENPISRNSELYEDAQASSHQQHASGYSSQRGHTSSMQNTYNANVQSSSASQVEQSAASSKQMGSSLHTHGANAGGIVDSASVLNGIDTKPKSYQSSYSYHKSWERQGDPYVIKPASEPYTSFDSQRLTAASKTHGYSSHQAHQGYSQSSNGLEDCDCDENGHRRVARSVRNQQQTEDLSQQSETSWSNLGQHAQRSWDKPADLRLNYASQQTLGQQEELQQVQQNQWGNLEDLGQQAQQSWHKPADLRQNHASQQANVQQEEGQQVQQNQQGNLEDLGQHAQRSWDKPENLRQSHQQSFSPQNSADFGQQVQQTQWDTTHPVPQRQSEQDILSEWPGYISQTDAYENQEQQSSHFKPMWPSSIEIKDEHLMPEDQQEMTQIVSSNFNQQHQEFFNTWAHHPQQEFYESSYGKENSQKVNFSTGPDSIDHSHDQETEQQAHKPWGSIDQWQDQRVPSSWLSDGYDKQDHSHRGSSAFSSWSQETTNKSSTQGSGLSSLWDKISQVDGVFLDTSVQKSGKDQENVNLTSNEDQVQGSQIGIISVSTTVKSTEIMHFDIPNITEKSRNIVQDVGRGDIGPEENLDEQEVENNTFKNILVPMSIPRENSVSDITQQANQSKIDGKKKDDQYYGEKSSFNKTDSEYGSWGTQYYYSGSYTNKSSLLNKTSEESQGQATFQIQDHSKDLEQSSLNIGQQKYKLDKVELEPVNQDIYQNWQQAESDTQTVWGQSLSSFNQQQDTAETFGVRLKDKDKQQQPTMTTLLAEPFKRESVKEKADIIQESNQKLLQQHSVEQISEQLNTSETLLKIKNTHTPHKTANIEAPVETSTSTPGFWKNAKNKIISWFKSS